MEASGNLLDAHVEALVNTVNCVGVTGKGIALQFKRAYPDMFRDYSRAAKAGEIVRGKMHVWPTGLLTGPRLIINFPTKGHWRERSELADIERGLVDLVQVLRDLDVKSVAIPPLGCGNGGLDWAVVKPRIYAALADLPEVDIVMYPPGPAPAARQMQTVNPRPPLTLARASLIGMLSQYVQRALEVSLIEVQKLVYFLQIAGEPMKLRFTKGIYGPYADNLRHALQSLEGHYLMGFGDGSTPVRDAEPIRLLPGAEEEAAQFLAKHPATRERINRVLDLAEGFESAYGMELLATVHWVSVNEPQAGSNADAAAAKVREWNRRKERIFTRDHVAAAWSALQEHHWITTA